MTTTYSLAYYQVYRSLLQTYLSPPDLRECGISLPKGSQPEADGTDVERVFQMLIQPAKV